MDVCVSDMYVIFVWFVCVRMCVYDLCVCVIRVCDLFHFVFDLLFFLNSNLSERFMRNCWSKICQIITYI